MMFIMNTKLSYKPLAAFLAALLVLSSCSKKKDIEFCEGVSPGGQGVNCGTVFEYGDVTALIKSRERFGTDRISVKIDILEKNKLIAVDIIKAEVRPDEIETIINLPLYKRGEYQITVLRGDTVLAEEKIEIAE